MTKDKADYTGQINSKKLGGTGITEALIGRHHRDEAGSLVIVASISVAATGKNVKEGTGSVNYVIDDLEVAPSIAVDHVRELIRSFEYERRLEAEGPSLLDTDGQARPKAEDVVAAGQRFEPHPYLASTLSTDDEPVCDICGQHEGAAVHANRSALADPFGVAEDDDAASDDDGGPANPDDPAYDDHEFIDDGDGTCVECNQHEDAAVHTDADELVTT